MHRGGKVPTAVWTGLLGCRLRRQRQRGETRPVGEESRLLGRTSRCSTPTTVCFTTSEQRKGRGARGEE